MTMEDNELMSRIEKILHKMLGDEIELDEAQSRNEELLIQVLKLIGNITFITSAEITEVLNGN